MSLPNSGRIVLKVFDHYKQLHKNLNIKSTFVIPHSPDWPKKYHGMKLGNYVKNIRRFLKGDSLSGFNKKDINTLIKNGFIVNAIIDKENRIFEACVEFQKKNGHCDINQKFKIDLNDDTWPERTRGLNLGQTFYEIKNKNSFMKIKPALAELGFNLDPTVVKAKESDHLDFHTQIYPALETYKSIHYNLKVPVKFIVPQDDERYPTESRGMKLGKICADIRNNGAYLEHKDHLLALGFNYKTKHQVDALHFIKIFAALEAYKAIHGNLDVTQSFVVPRDDVRYPIDTWGMKLGTIVSNIRNRGDHAKHRVKLEELGFIYDSPFNAQFTKIYAALEAYKAVCGDLKVPKVFVVPQGDDRYPIDTWGMKLGTTVSSIRNRGFYAHHRAKLEELGFVYKDSKPIVEID